MIFEMNKKTMMIALVLFLMFVQIPTMAFAQPTISYCVNSSYVQINRTMYVAVDGNSTAITIDDLQYCNNGCSETLGECRFDELWQIVVLVLFIILITSFIMITRKIRVLSFSAVIIGSLASVMIAVTDIFVEPLNIILLILPLALIGEMIIITLSNRKEEEEI